MSTSKRSTYRATIARMDAAMRAGYFLEASWIAFAIIEDRTDSALNKTGGLLADPRAMLGRKLAELERRAASHPGLVRIAGFKANVKLVRAWSRSRNPLMHQLLKSPRPWQHINADAQGLAHAARPIVASYCTNLMKLRRWSIKQRRKTAQSRRKQLSP